MLHNVVKGLEYLEITSIVLCYILMKYNRVMMFNVEYY